MSGYGLILGPAPGHVTWQNALLARALRPISDVIAWHIGDSRERRLLLRASPPGRTLFTKGIDRGRLCGRPTADILQSSAFDEAETAMSEEAAPSAEPARTP